MAKKSMVARRNKKLRTFKKYGEKRNAIKDAIKNASSFEEVMQNVEKLQKLPVNSSKSRIVTRCGQCGRPKAVYRKFGLCRICLRKHLMLGNIPGGKKSSW